MNEKIQKLEAGDLEQFKKGLQSAQLPTHDLPDDVSQFLSYKEDDKLLAGIGAEYYGKTALLRSLFTDPRLRSQGIGTDLIQCLEKNLLADNIQEVYLLTTTAAEFFRKRGYKIIDRDKVAQEIKETVQFSSSCPSSAIVMHKTLG